MFEIVQCSPNAEARIAADFDESKAAPVGNNMHHRVKYPFDLLHVRQAFAVPFAQVSECSLRVSAANRGKSTGKKFAVIKHAAAQVFEVARIG